MKTIFHRYRPLWLGGLITFVATAILAGLGVLLIDPKAVGENVALFTLWWLIIAFLIYRFQLVKNKSGLLLRIGTLLSLLGGILLAEDYSDMTDNPVVVFINAGSGNTNVVYRRGDGNIGWIDPN